MAAILGLIFQTTHQRRSIERSTDSLTEAILTRASLINLGLSFVEIA